MNVFENIITIIRSTTDFTAIEQMRVFDLFTSTILDQQNKYEYVVGVGPNTKKIDELTHGDNTIVINYKTNSKCQYKSIQSLFYITNKQNKAVFKSRVHFALFNCFVRLTSGLFKLQLQKDMSVKSIKVFREIVPKIEQLFGQFNLTNVLDVLDYKLMFNEFINRHIPTIKGPFTHIVSNSYPLYLMSSWINTSGESVSITFYEHKFRVLTTDNVANKIHEGINYVMNDNNNNDNSSIQVSIISIGTHSTDNIKTFTKNYDTKITNDDEC